MIVVALAGVARAGALPLVPALQSWQASRGDFSLRDDAHVVVRRGERRRLGAEARTLAVELGGLLGHPVRTSTLARRGDVLLTLTSRDAGLGGEGYSLRVVRVFTIALCAP